jgi:hypothetical protein
LALAERAVATLVRLLPVLEGEIARDAAIKRFEYSCDASWKAAQAALRSVEALDVASPKSAVRECGRVGWLSPGAVQAALAMFDDRNVTVHAYDEAYADAIVARLPAHAATLRLWLDAIRERLGS